MYSSVLIHRHKLPVQSVMILLRPEADCPELSGHLQLKLSDGRVTHDFYYDVVRLWQIPVESLLQGEYATLPLAPLANMTLEQLPEVLSRIEKRVASEVGPGEAIDYHAATLSLMGLRYPKAMIAELMKGFPKMKVSVTYELILEEGIEQGKLSGALEVILRLYRGRLGEPNPTVLDRLKAITSQSVVERMVDLYQKVETWDELLLESQIT